MYVPDPDLTYALSDVVSPVPKKFMPVGAYK
jgi:hypothetical protein